MPVEGWDGDAQTEPVRHPGEREGPPAADTLLIKVLHVVSGGALLGALSQTDVLIDLAGIGSFLIFLSAMGLALVAAVFAAHWRNQHLAWDIQVAASESVADGLRRHSRSRRYLKAMRAGMRAALLLVAVGFIQLIACLWVVGLSDQQSLPETQAAAHVAFAVPAPARPTVEARLRGEVQVAHGDRAAAPDTERD